MNYHNTGKLLIGAQDDENRVKYGDGLIKEYSKKLSEELGGKYNITTLKRMRQFYLLSEKIATLSQQLTWSHFVEILPIQDELKRDFYAAMCMQENWSVRTLRERKKSMLYERTAISKKPEERKEE